MIQDIFSIVAIWAGIVTSVLFTYDYYEKAVKSGKKSTGIKIYEKLNSFYSPDSYITVMSSMTLFDCISRDITAKNVFSSIRSLSIDEKNLKNFITPHLPQNPENYMIRGNADKFLKYINRSDSKFPGLILMMEESVEIFKRDIDEMNKADKLPEIDVTKIPILNVKLSQYSSDKSQVIVEYADIIGIIPLDNVINLNTANDEIVSSFEKEHSGKNTRDYFSEFGIGDYFDPSQMKKFETCEPCEPLPYMEDEGEEVVSSEAKDCVPVGIEGDLHKIPIVPSSDF